MKGRNKASCLEIDYIIILGYFMAILGMSLFAFLVFPLFLKFTFAGDIVSADKLLPLGILDFLFIWYGLKFSGLLRILFFIEDKKPKRRRRKRK